MNIQAVRDFYKMLAHNKQTEIRVIEVLEDPLKPSKFKSELKDKKFVSSEQEFLEVIKKYDGIYNLYAGLNERRDQGTEAKDVISVKRIFVDIDCKIKPASHDDMKEAEKITDQIITLIENKTGGRPTKIMSGNGYQLIYYIPEIKITDDNREQINNQVQQFLQDLIKKYKHDKIQLDNVGDLPRIMKVTGTVNTKGGKVAEFIEIHTDENQKLKEYILSLKPETTVLKIADLDTTLNEILEKDERVKLLFNADPEICGKYQSRSECEIALVCHLIGLGLDRKQVFNAMASCKIGKWQEANLSYKDITFQKALKIVTDKKRDVISIKKNPFKKLYYTTKHLPNFDNLDSILGLYGKHYLPIKKARWYQLVGGSLQKEITIGEKHTDTRINCLYPLPTEQGKNDLIYLFKNVIEPLGLTLEKPISYHPEQLIGKVIEVFIDNPNGKKPKQIKKKFENRGYFAADFIEIDEANILIFNKDDQTRQAREYISIALNPIGRNEVVKKLVADISSDRVQYCPKCTVTAYFQPSKMIEQDLFLQGFLRRFLVPVGNIEPFLNYGSEADFKRKLSPPEISKQQCIEDIVNYLSSIRIFMVHREFVFTTEATDMIVTYLQYLIAQGQKHSARISNLIKLFKWTIQEYLIKMSCILAGSYQQYVVDKSFVTLAYMDLVELLQSTFDFIEQRTYGDFDYGTGWQGANYKEKTCLEYLNEKRAFSNENSTVSVEEFVEYIKQVYEIKETRARQHLAKFKKKGYVESKQIGSYDSRVWLTFVPQIENMIYEGDKADKGYNIYESINSDINSIIEGVKSLSPLLPLDGVPTEIIKPYPLLPSPRLKEPVCPNCGSTDILIETNSVLCKHCLVGSPIIGLGGA